MFEVIDDASIDRMVRAFYAKVRQDPELGPIFEAAVHDWEEHLQRLQAFWSSVMLASGRYKGQPMAAHFRLPIEPSMFTRWLQLWGETAEELFTLPLAARFRGKAERIAESLKLGLFFRADLLDQSGETRSSARSAELRSASSSSSITRSASATGTGLSPRRRMASRTP